MLYSLKLICVQWLNLPFSCLLFWYFQALCRRGHAYEEEPFRKLYLGWELDPVTSGLQPLQSHYSAVGEP